MLKGSVFILAAVAQAAHLVDYDNLHLRTVYARQQSGVVAAAVQVNNFSYTGETGPLNWANLPGWANNRVCATGRNQSPINIDGTIGAGAAPVINYADGRDFILENIGTTLEGITDQANLAAMTVQRSASDRKQFTFNNFHFHTPSEHRFGEESYPMEMHIVNSAPDENLVLTVLFQFAASDHQFISGASTLAENVRQPGSSTIIRGLRWSLLGNIWTDSAARKVYRGSLTTPPCTENTQFVISTTPIGITHATYNTIKDIMNFNSRYTQNTPGRANLLQLPQPRA